MEEVELNSKQQAPSCVMIIFFVCGHPTFQYSNDLIGQYATLVSVSRIDADFQNFQRGQRTVGRGKSCQSYGGGRPAAPIKSAPMVSRMRVQSVWIIDASPKKQPCGY